MPNNKEKGNIKYNIDNQVGGGYYYQWLISTYINIFIIVKGDKNEFRKKITDYYNTLKDKVSHEYLTIFKNENEDKFNNNINNLIEYIYNNILDIFKTSELWNNNINQYFNYIENIFIGEELKIKLEEEKDFVLEDTNIFIEYKNKKKDIFLLQCKVSSTLNNAKYNEIISKYIGIKKEYKIKNNKKELFIGKSVKNDLINKNNNILILDEDNNIINFKLILIKELFNSTDKLKKGLYGDFKLIEIKLFSNDYDRGIHNFLVKSEEFGISFLESFLFSISKNNFIINKKKYINDKGKILAFIKQFIKTNKNIKDITGGGIFYSLKQE